MIDPLKDESESTKRAVYKLLTNDDYPEDYALHKMTYYLLDIHDIRSIELAIRQAKYNESNRKNK